MALDYERVRSILTDALGGELGYFTTHGGATIPAMQLDDGTEDLVNDWESITGLQVTIVVDLEIPFTQLLGNKGLGTERAVIVLAQHTPGQPLFEPTQRAMMALQKGYLNLKVDPPRGSRASARLDRIGSMNFVISLTSHWAQ
ncbi:hypothetical protein [Leptolyngbya sp. FACHB-16]|uniref:hypothetical protein n=1 Tax=unclassified Leptolyngbya TaxID=2650499 RepID=UPI0016825B22|nr:hypothetical protein [Leptolyngbya sp. FACHB-16]MBD2156238.1 hypothetical protein [Leptolyngbya sp. FACHB-16]